MIECLKTTLVGTDLLTQPITTPEPGCWINVVSPDSNDRDWLLNQVDIAPEFVRSAFDDEESSHIDYDDDANQTLIIVDCPFVEDASEAEDPDIVQYDTHPLSFIFLPEKDMLVTVSLRENAIVSQFASGHGVRRMNTNQRTRLFLQIFLRISQRYVIYLRNIDRQFNRIEASLRRDLRNSELIKMLGFEKSLVYFSTSLKADEATLTKVSSGRAVRLYEDDRDLLDDVFIELRQAIEMSAIYTNILDGTMDTFASVISNNLNITMRTLTIITLVLAIPTMVFSFYGMNVSDLPAADTFAFPIICAFIGCGIAAIFFWRSRLFK